MQNYFIKSQHCKGISDQDLQIFTGINFNKIIFLMLISLKLNLKPLPIAVSAKCKKNCKKFCLPLERNLIYLFAVKKNQIKLL